jgi:hypothetical protein
MTKQFLKGRKPLIFNVVADPYGAGLLSTNKQDNKT